MYLAGWIQYNGTFTENSFLNVEGQISLKGGRYDVISRNNFNLVNLVSGTQANNLMGIYFNNSTGYKVVDNQFYEMTYGINGINSGINSGSFIGYQTSGNVFNTTKWPVGLLFNNSGLQLKCNIFNNSDPTLYDNNWYMGGNSVLADQGQFSNTNEKAPSGNWFDQSPDFNELFSDITNPLFTYFRHGGNSPQEVIPAVQIGSPININAGSIAMSNFEEACEPIPPCDPPCERMQLQGFIEVLDSLSGLRSELLAELDNQSRDALINALQFPYSKDSLFNFLINSSPLSDTILSLSINCIDSLPEENLEVVLSVNSPFSDVVWQSLMNRAPSLDPQTLERILALQGVNPPYETVTRIDKVSKHYWNEYYLTTNDFYRRLSDQDSLDVIIDFLKTTGTTNNLQQAFTLYLSGNELDSATSLFEFLSSVDDVDEQWLSLNGILMELAIEEKTIFELDSSQLAIVEQVANTEEMSLSKINAESILSVLNWEVYPYILPEGSSNRMYNTNSTRSIINDNKLLSIYPNPTDDHFFIIDKFMAGDIIEIRNMIGELIYRLNVQATKNILQMEVGQISNGLYTVEKINNGMVNKTGKLVISKR